MEKKRLVDERTTIQIRKATLKKLKILKATGDYRDIDSVIQSLLEKK